MKGQITTFDEPRGWGFIENEDQKYFFHVKNSPGYTPVLGTWVEFDTASPFKMGQRDQAVKLRSVEGVA
jgi:cold shock CspA family protein